MIDKNKLVGKEKAVVRTDDLELELPLHVSKICTVCPYWPEEGALDFLSGTLRPKCNRPKCTGYLEKDMDDVFKPMNDTFRNLFYT